MSGRPYHKEAAPTVADNAEGLSLYWLAFWREIRRLAQELDLREASLALEQGSDPQADKAPAKPDPS